MPVQLSSILRGLACTFTDTNFGTLATPWPDQHMPGALFIACAVVAMNSWQLVCHMQKNVSSCMPVCPAKHNASAKQTWLDYMLEVYSKLLLCKRFQQYRHEFLRMHSSFQSQTTVHLTETAKTAVLQWKIQILNCWGLQYITVQHLGDV